MEKKYWFKAKTWGYGWSYPLTWQGWLVYFLTLGPIAAFVWWAVFNAPPKTSDEDFNRISLIAAGVMLFVLMPVLAYFCVKKGEPARWRWGRK